MILQRILLFVVLVFTRKATSSLTEDEKKVALEAHNQARSMVQPTASSMLKMSWSDDLATSAQRLADMCVYAHDTGQVSDLKYQTFGQNIYVTTGEKDMTIVIDSFDKEKRNYTFDSNTCNAVCGHYTQVVWAETHLVGCGKTFCSNVEGAFENAYLFFCNYSPQGNFNGRRPFFQGDSCSKCPAEASKCSNNLCETGSGDPPSNIPGADPPSNSPDDDPPSNSPDDDPPSKSPVDDPPSDHNSLASTLKAGGFTVLALLMAYFQF